MNVRGVKKSAFVLCAHGDGRGIAVDTGAGGVPY